MFKGMSILQPNNVKING